MVNAAKPSANEGHPPNSIFAAEYVRMSTEHQRYSTENQSDSIKRYAEQRGITIVRSYADHGKSGLRVDGRDALKRLIDDVQAGTVPDIFRVVARADTVHDLVCIVGVQGRRRCEALSHADGVPRWQEGHRGHVTRNRVLREVG